jgi:hypothetical protein
MAKIIDLETKKEIAYTGKTLADLWEEVKPGKYVSPLFDRNMGAYIQYNGKLTVRWGKFRDRGVELPTGASYEDAMAAIHAKYSHMQNFEALLDVFNDPAWHVFTLDEINEE